ncbi:MAG: hypothetical protein ACXAAH_09770 [Promethearchaeota archaeon]|jgi:hypothetical protein
MVVREAGLIFRGFNLVKRSYHKSTKGKVDPDLRSGLLTAIISFAESAFTRGSVEYFEGDKFLIAFTDAEIMSEDGIEPEVLRSYAIMDKEKKMENYMQKVILPLLKKVIKAFMTSNLGKNLSEVSQFKEFKKTLDDIFGTDTQTVDQKLKGIFTEEKKSKKKKKKLKKKEIKKEF